MTTMDDLRTSPRLLSARQLVYREPKTADPRRPSKKTDSEYLPLVLSSSNGFLGAGVAMTEQRESNLGAMVRHEVGSRLGR